MIVYHLFFKKAIYDVYFLRYFFSFFTKFHKLLLFLSKLMYNDCDFALKRTEKMRYCDIRARLRAAGIESDAHEAALLLSYFEGVPSADIPLIGERDFKSAALEDALCRREKHEPLQYIIGEWYFMGERYVVNENCLIPRQDTELLVETAVELLPTGAVFADFCTGSGCVAVSTLAARCDTRAFAIELFDAALELAVQNAKINGVAERFSPAVADVTKPLPLDKDIRFDAIISNPPYIRTGELDLLSDEVKHEPRAALDGGPDGMDFYRAILKNGAPRLKENGFFAFEIGSDEGGDIHRIAEMNAFSCELRRDLCGNDRVAVLRKRIK